MIDPDDFQNDWYGWLTNQCGHIVLRLAVSVAMLWAVWWSPVVAAAAYWFLVEGLTQRWKLWRDSLMDTFFVMAGSEDVDALQSILSGGEVNLMQAR